MYNKTYLCHSSYVLYLGLDICQIKHTYVRMYVVILGQLKVMAHDSNIKLKNGSVFGRGLGVRMYIIALVCVILHFHTLDVVDSYHHSS